MAQDIEEFLRMAAARKKQQQQGQNAKPQQQSQQQQAAQQSAAQQQSSQQQSAQQQNRFGAAQQRTQPNTGDADIYIMDDLDAVDSGHPDLQSRIRTTVSTEDIVEHASHLGEGVHARTDVVEARVNHKFDHELGSLKKNEIGAPAVVDHGKGHEQFTDISPVLKMLRSPASLQQAIILKEIFDRPKF